MQRLYSSPLALRPSSSGSAALLHRFSSSIIAVPIACRRWDLEDQPCFTPSCGNSYSISPLCSCWIDSSQRLVWHQPFPSEKPAAQHLPSSCSSIISGLLKIGRNNKPCFMSRPCYMGRLYLISQFCFMSLVLHRNTEEK